MKNKILISAVILVGIVLYVAAQPITPFSSVGSSSRVPIIPYNGDSTYYLDGSGKFSKPSGSGGGSAIWTNNANFIWPAGSPAPDSSGTLRGPSTFLRNDGSAFVGTNVNQDVNIIDFTQLFLPHAVLFTGSNEPPTINIFYAIANNENYTFFSQLSGEVHNDKDSPFTYSDWHSHSTNGIDHEVRVEADPAHADNQTELSISTNTVTVFSADANGTVTANKYVQPTGTPGLLLAYQGGNVLGPTNGTGATFSIFGTTNFLKFGATNTAPASTVTPTKWVSVQINGEGVAYRIPLYQ